MNTTTMNSNIAAELARLKAETVSTAAVHPVRVHSVQCELARLRAEKVSA